MTESLDGATRIFKCAEAAEFGYEPVRDVDVADFSDSYRRFKRSLGDAKDDTYWRRFLRPLGYYRFEILAAPLPLNSAVLQPDQRLERLGKALKRLSQLYPQQAEDAEALVSRFEMLSNRADNPLLSSIRTAAQERGAGDTAVVISESRLVAGVAGHFDTELGNIGLTVVSPREARERPPFAEMYLVGRITWFPAWMIRAPRASQVTLVSYSGIKANVSPGPLFNGTKQGRPVAPVELEDENDESEGGSIEAEGDDLGDLDIRPQLDLDVIEDRMRREADSSSDREGREPSVPAQPIELERDKVVFFEKEDEATTWVIDLDEVDDDRVRRLSVQALEPGMYILLRTEGGGDVLVPIANELLGNEAERLRRMQREWKSALRDYLRDAGVQRTVRDLKEAGCDVASRINVKRWVSPSPHVIKTKKREHFKAIIETVGLGDTRGNYWKSMVAIRDMHLRAGQVIRERLLASIAQANLQDMVGEGVVRFELADVDAGQLAAYRIRSVPDRAIRLPRGRLREVMVGSVV